MVALASGRVGLTAHKRSLPAPCLDLLAESIRLRVTGSKSRLNLWRLEGIGQARRLLGFAHENVSDSYRVETAGLRKSTFKEPHLAISVAGSEQTS
jgi:hypothetical protein